MKERTIRELGGEVWAELESRLLRDPVAYKGFHEDVQLLHKTIDIMMGVLARYENHQIINDKDLPVSKLEDSKL
jgi:hypothetical protein